MVGTIRTMLEEKKRRLTEDGSTGKSPCGPKMGICSAMDRKARKR